MPESELDGLGMDAFERFLFLRSVPSLTELPPEVVRVIAAHTHQERFTKGSHLYREGQPALYVHCIVRGSVEIRRHGNPIRRLGVRTIAGGLPAMAGDDQGYDCIAVEDTVTLQIASDDAREIFEDHFVLLKSVFEHIGREVIVARKQLGPKAGFPEPGPPLACPDRVFDLVERMAFLRKNTGFRDADIEAIADLASEVTEVRLDAGEPLWDIGDPSTHFLMPLCGTIECVARDPEQRFVLGPTDSVGSIDALSAEPRWFRARVEKPLIALKVEIDVLYDVLEDHFEMTMSLLRGISVAILRLYDLKAGARSD